MKLLIEIETTVYYDKEMKEDLAGDIISSMGHGIKTIKIKAEESSPNLNSAKVEDE